jgi:arsenate reductase
MSATEAAAAAELELQDSTASLFPPRAEGLKRKLGRPTVYHYPRSRSSYGAIRLLEASSLQPRIIDITSDPLLPRDVERLMGELGIDHPRGLMRVDDPLYAELGLGEPTLEREALVQAMLDHPRLMRRPIVEVPYREGGERKRAVVIAQPPQRLFAVLLAESEEEALGLVPTPPAEETEADRWAREWSQAEVPSLSLSLPLCVSCDVLRELTGAWVRACACVCAGSVPTRPGADR